MTPLEVAREAVQAAALGEDYTPPALEPPWDEPKPVFVTLRKRGQLRGCIGALSISKSSLAEEIAASARAAALKDPRFPAVSPEELPSIDLEVSVLEPSEPVDSLDSLDPKTWGVIVSQGRRRGVLLPGIPTVDTVKQQLAIAKQKAGIVSDQDLRIQRFAVTKLQ